MVPARPDPAGQTSWLQRGREGSRGRHVAGAVWQRLQKCKKPPTLAGVGGFGRVLGCVWIRHRGPTAIASGSLSSSAMSAGVFHDRVRYGIGRIISAMPIGPRA
jgi:hypothetical protein